MNTLENKYLVMTNCSP